MDETNIVYEKNNRKVPVAILSCFLIAFIIQGVLKICGVFVFGKALDWEIFKIAENNKVLKIFFCSIIIFFNMYCLSFAFTEKPYSNKWYHYFIMILAAGGIATYKLFVLVDIKIQIVIDVLIYIIIPFVINMTNDKYRAFKVLTFTNIITTLAVHILLYFCYLGLTYWSGLLTSFIITEQIFITTSNMFLLYSELYIGLALLMLSMNNFIYDLKGGKINGISN